MHHHQLLDLSGPAHDPALTPKGKVISMTTTPKVKQGQTESQLPSTLKKYMDALAGDHVHVRVDFFVGGDKI